MKQIIEIPKVVKLTIRKRYYETLGTSVTNFLLSLLSLYYNAELKK